jgi:endonuclease YncB( thermonuclease family)
MSAVIAAGLMFVCTPVAVWDGDGPIWCAEGPRVRIAGIAAREMDGSCRPHQPCPRATAAEARDALVRLLGGARGEFHADPRAKASHVRVAGPAMTCLSDGVARGNRTAAWCRLPDGRDLSCALLATGTVKKWKVFWRGRLC